MRIPRKITPCPIASSVAEIRFTSNSPADAVLGLAVAGLRHEFKGYQKLPIADLPSAVRDQERDLEYAPHYELHSDKYMMRVGPKCFSVAHKGEYPGWSELGPTIVRLMTMFFKTSIIKEISRGSIRYTNFFASDVFDHLVANLTLENKPLNSNETMLRTIIRWEGLSHILLVTNTAEKDGLRGSVLDIDTLYSGQTEGIIADYAGILERLHQAEKSLFYSLLKPGFVASLNPEYEV